MISSNDLRNGMTIIFEGGLYSIIDAEHVKQARGSAFVRVRMRNVETGATVSRTLRAAEKIEQAIVERPEMQYLYSSGDEHYFMDLQTYEQLPVAEDMLGDALKFLKENMTVQVVTYKGRAIGVELPNSVDLEVTRTEPGLRGDTVSGGSKPAELETGATVNVPLFINIGDVIRVDTRSGEYLGRA